VNALRREKARNLFGRRRHRFAPDVVNGVKTTRTVSVLSGTPSGSGSLVYIGSSTSTFTDGRAGVYVP
jgi:hypothetical protein